MNVRTASLGQFVRLGSGAVGIVNAIDWRRDAIEVTVTDDGKEFTDWYAAAYVEPSDGKYRADFVVPRGDDPGPKAA